MEFSNGDQRVYDIIPPVQQLTAQGFGVAVSLDGRDIPSRDLFFWTASWL